MKRNHKGFTLAELLIVVAIIAVLTAIAIPVFSGNLEKAREGADAANLRAAYAMAAAKSLDLDGRPVVVTDITLKQRGLFEKLGKSGEPVMIGNVQLNDGAQVFNPYNTWALGYDANGKVYIGSTTEDCVSKGGSALSGYSSMKFTGAGE